MNNYTKIQGKITNDNDFIRIGGEIASAPLNENFRRLINAVTISNMNLIYPEENGIVSTVEDMYAIENPLNAQTCYVISSGAFYRYAVKDNEWHKIMDIGQTFRQGFLNSGLVVAEDKINYVEKKILRIPKMLLYFKNKEGDGRYLKGMYLFEEKELNVATLIDGTGAYSILVDANQKYYIVSGMPLIDDPNKIYLGSFLIDKDNKMLSDFIFTIPDIAYTADRGQFILKGGDCSGCNLLPSKTGGKKVNRNSGLYYDEGVNYTIGDTTNFPIDTDNGSNFDIKIFESVAPLTDLYYGTPSDFLNNEISKTNELIIDKYWSEDERSLLDVPSGYYTIQNHFITPNGNNIILYGDELYNSLTDAISNLNKVYGLSVDFPYVEVTRIVVGNVEDFSTDNTDTCQFFTLGRLAQVGTISPKFGDDEFLIYSGDADDTTPSSIKFDLADLQENQFNSIYNLGILPFTVERQLFSLNKKYTTDDIIEEVSTVSSSQRAYGEKYGYQLADNVDLDYLVDRVSNIEKEIWNIYDVNNTQRYNQSIRYRLHHHDLILDDHTIMLSNHENRVASLEQNRVRKETTINGYTLGDTTNVDEKKAIQIMTGDINEGFGKGEVKNLWYTEDRVSANTKVAAATAHINTKSANDSATTHIKINPHNLSTDDINYLTDTTKVFITPEEERRIRSDRLPENTIEEIENLDNTKIDSISIQKIDGNSIETTGTITNIGNVKGLRIYEDGVNLSVNDGIATLECVGQTDYDSLMFKSRYASLENEYPELFGGYVDNAVNAEYANNVNGIEDASANQYYGTNNNSEVGIYDLPKYITTADAEGWTDLNQVIFVPVNGSITEEHLSNDLSNKINNNYHSVYDNGTLISNEINSFNFGNNLRVDIDGNKVTINGVGGTGSGENRLVNLDDVDISYSGNSGKVLTVNEEETGIILSDSLDMKRYMLKSVYVDPDNIYNIRKATLADNSLKVNNKEVDNTSITEGLWTASQIISNTSLQIRNEGVNTYSGITVPEDTLGKNGDIYVLIEE